MAPTERGASGRSAPRRGGPDRSGGARGDRRATPPGGGTGEREARPADAGDRGGRSASGSYQGRAPGSDRRRSGSASTRTGPAGIRRSDQPDIDEDVTGAELDRTVRAQLATLPATVAPRVARHLVMAARTLEADPELAWRHARAARAVHGATRVAAVREAVGLAAYAAGRYAEALPELKAARRISGSDELVPVIADSERGVGQPERAVRLVTEAAATARDPALRAELLIVGAGAHRDLGRLDAALVTLRVPALHGSPASRGSRPEPWLARLRYAYADALAAAGEAENAAQWFAAASEVDDAGATDAAERLAELQGVAFLSDPEFCGGDADARPPA